MGGLELYEKVRRDLRAGDAITWETDGAVSWLIRRWTSRNHATLVMRKIMDGGIRRLVLEAVGSGVEMRLLSKRLSASHGKAYWHPLLPELAAYRPAIAKTALRYLGDRYDYQGLLKNIFGRVSTNMSMVFCSELISKSIVSAIPKDVLEKYRPNKPLDMLLAGKALRPGDLSELSLYKKEVRIL